MLVAGECLRTLARMRPNTSRFCGMRVLAAEPGELVAGDRMFEKDGLRWDFTDQTLRHV